MTKTVMLASALASSLAMMAPPADKGSKPAEAPAPLAGADLLAAIASGEVTRITQPQAATLDASFYEVNTADVVDDAAAVTLTDAGKAAAGVTPAEAAGKEVFVIDEDLPMPEFGTRQFGSRESVYPFDKLEVGKSFHVAKTAEREDPASTLSSSITGAHIRYSDVLKDEAGAPIMEEYDAPKFIDGPDGKKVREGTEKKTREKRGEPSRQFRMQRVTKDDPRGEGVRIWRVK